MKMCKVYAAILICLLCLIGCQKKEASSVGEEMAAGKEVSVEITSTEETAELFTIDQETGSFAVAGAPRNKQSLWAAEYIRWEHDSASENGMMRSVVLDDRIYQLLEITAGKDADRRYQLDIYDVSTMQVTVTAINSERLGIDGGFIADMSVIDQGMYAFLIMKYEPKETGGYRLLRADIVYSDLEDELEKVDLMPAIQEKGLEDIYQECYCDAFGNIYLREIHGNLASNHLFILDRNGSLCMDQSLKEDDVVMPPFRMPDGKLIFPVNNYAEYTARLVSFDPEEKKIHVLANLEKESIEQIYGMQGTELYYDSYEGIVKWDLVSGDRTLVFSFEENSVSNIYNTMLVFRDGEMPVFRMYAKVNGRVEDWLMPLSGQEPESAEAIQIVSLNGDSANVRDCVALASRRNPGLSFTYKTCTETEKEEFRTRILAELMAGDGPDILYVSLEDMRRLQDMGALADLDSSLTEKSKDCILPGIIELGTVNGTFVGLAPDMTLSSMVTLKSIWEQDTWDLEDVIGLLDTGEFTGIFCQGTTPFAPQALLLFLTKFGLRESVLIDWETRESHFDSELFPKILEITKTYGAVDPLKIETWLGSGGCPGMFIGPNIESFNELYEQYGDEYYFVGEPTSGTSGSYLSSQGVLVVNKNTANSKAVSAYLSCLLEDEIQYPNRPYPNQSILKVSLGETTTVETVDGTKIFWKNYRLQLKEDGTTTLRDYKDFLESCIPQPESYDDILSIVWEESQSYIAGDKSAKDVARIIDSRIQLYLDEGNGGTEN